ncbi:conserved Plasmodium protein, unknown function [Plasmodium gonderi]|uniref:Uncharacterized protein n=1 Tax=Plasmodium gonderi TaxID=77519 RepID=A0A1Y1JBQ5_PLAGO|nr:conserved Plasmodium protein, unknown function [Plasmodium gonderi]GAW79961.1 conserved Plasmodium protein, unknown function [Plasmodium gonderi]
MIEANDETPLYFNRKTITETNVSSDMLKKWNDNQTNSRTSLKDIHLRKSMNKAYSSPVEFQKKNSISEQVEENKIQEGRRSTHLVNQTAVFLSDDQRKSVHTNEHEYDTPMGEKSSELDAAKNKRKNSNVYKSSTKEVYEKIPSNNILNKLTKTLLMGIQEKVQIGIKKRDNKEKHKGRVCSNSENRNQKLWSTKDQVRDTTQNGNISKKGSHEVIFQRIGKFERSRRGDKTDLAYNSASCQNSKDMAKTERKKEKKQEQGKEKTFYVYETEGYIPRACENTVFKGLEEQQRDEQQTKNKNVCFADERGNNNFDYVEVSQPEQLYIHHSFQSSPNPYYLQGTVNAIPSSNHQMMNDELEKSHDMAFNTGQGEVILYGATSPHVPVGHSSLSVDRSASISNLGNSAAYDMYGYQLGYTDYEGKSRYQSHGVGLNVHPSHGRQIAYPNYTNYNVREGSSVPRVAHVPKSALIRSKTIDFKNRVIDSENKICNMMDLPTLPTSSKKKFFCNRSLKNNEQKDLNQSKEYKTEILIYQNEHLKSYKKNSLEKGVKKKKKKKKKSRSPLIFTNKGTIFPSNTNVFIRTKSLQPFRSNKKNCSISPLKNISFGRQTSVPLSTQSRGLHTIPDYTQEISYTYPSKNKNMNGWDKGPQVIKSFTSTVPYGTHQNSVIIQQHKNLSDSNKIRFSDDSKSYLNKCSTEASSKTSDNGSTLNNHVKSLNAKIGRLNSRIRSINAEKWNLSELARMYKNECNRLREVIVKNKKVHYDPLNFRKINYEQMNAKLEEENEKLRNQMKVLGKAILSSYDINGIKKILARQIVNLNEENEKYRHEIKLLHKQKDVNREILFNLNRGDVSVDAIDSVFMQTKNVIIEGHQTMNVFYLNLKNLIEEFFQKIKFLIMEDDYSKNEKLMYVTSLEELVNENFEEIKHIVVKINELRKKMKDVKAHIFDTDRSNPNCSCKPSRIILEDDINHLEEELHNHSIMLKNLRKKNLSLCLNNLHCQFNHEKQKSDQIMGKDPLNLEDKDVNVNDNSDGSYHSKLHEKDVPMDLEFHKYPKFPELPKIVKGENHRFTQADCTEVAKRSKECNKEEKKNKINVKHHTKDISSNTSSSSCLSSSDESGSEMWENKNWLSEEEMERSKRKMIELLALLKGKHNEDLVENTKNYVNSFGEYKSNNKYNLQKIYDNLKAIRNTIKNTDDDTEKNILDLIESQANEIKILGNCVDNLKTTMAP